MTDNKFTDFGDPFILSILAGNDLSVSSHLAKGMPFDAKTLCKYGDFVFSPVGAACRMRSSSEDFVESVVDSILEAGGDINCESKEDEERFLPLDYAIQTNRIRLAKKIDALMEPNVIGNQNSLFLSVERNDQDAIDILLKRGYPVNARNPNGETPIMYASTLTTFQKMAEAGAETEATDKKGRDVMQHIVTKVTKKEREKIVSFIKNGWSREKDVLKSVDSIHALLKGTNPKKRILSDIAGLGLTPLSKGTDGETLWGKIIDEGRWDVASEMFWQAKNDGTAICDGISRFLTKALHWPRWHKHKIAQIRFAESAASEDLDSVFHPSETEMVELLGQVGESWGKHSSATRPDVNWEFAGKFAGITRLFESDSVNDAMKKLCGQLISSEQQTRFVSTAEGAFLAKIIRMAYRKSRPEWDLATFSSFVKNNANKEMSEPILAFAERYGTFPNFISLSTKHIQRNECDKIGGDDAMAALRSDQQNFLLSQRVSPKNERKDTLGL